MLRFPTSSMILGWLKRGGGSGGRVVLVHPRETRCTYFVFMKVIDLSSWTWISRYISILICVHEPSYAHLGDGTDFRVVLTILQYNGIHKYSMMCASAACDTYRIQSFVLSPYLVFVRLATFWNIDWKGYGQPCAHSPSLGIDCSSSSSSSWFAYLKKYVRECRKCFLAGVHGLFAIIDTNFASRGPVVKSWVPLHYLISMACNGLLCRRCRRVQIGEQIGEIWFKLGNNVHNAFDLPFPQILIFLRFELVQWFVESVSRKNASTSTPDGPSPAHVELR